MPKYKLTIEYDGRPFLGWQVQDDGPTVQGVLESAVAVINGAASAVHGSGRTDAGVHALRQVAHVELGRDWDCDVLRNAINANVRPHPVSVISVEAVAPDFHARFSARRRHYLYRILNRRAPPALDAGRVWWVPTSLSAQIMQDAAQRLVGKHDFTTFRAAGCQAKSPIKTLDRLDVTQSCEELQIRAEARSFLHHQVRSMVGSLKLVGEGKWTPDDLTHALEARDRSACGPVAPPDGLYLFRVDY